ncbi:MAG: DNA polymerase Y family protein [Rubrobacteraceae bacterium]
MFFKLGRRERDPAEALAVGRRMKQEIRDRVGEFLLCSVGLTPNRFLAKMAGKMQKPDGLTVLTQEDLPHGLYPLALRDLTGIGRRMHARLQNSGVTTVEQLCSLSKNQLRNIWKGVVGERWWYTLRGYDLPQSPTRRRSVSHSHVLPPEFRTQEGAKAVLVRLVHKAAARLRKLGYWAGGMSVHVSSVRREKWKAAASLGLCQDTQTIVRTLSALWKERRISGIPLKVSVVLYDLIPEASTTPPLFVESPGLTEMTRAMDSINSRFGANTIYLAAMHRSANTAPSRISFTHIPDIAIETTRGPKRPAPFTAPVV